MKKILILLTLFASLFASAQKRTLYGTGFQFVDAQPGDTLILPEKFSGLYLKSGGSAERPIVLTDNGNGSVNWVGFDFSNAPHTRLVSSSRGKILVDHTGIASENDAIKITETTVAEDIEINGVAFKGNYYGARVKNEASTNAAQNNWVIKNIRFINCDFQNSVFQHLYIGSTNLDGKARPFYVEGKLVSPPSLEGVTVDNCTFDVSGRAAVQLSNVVKGALIRNNRITRAGRETEGQGNGINLGRVRGIVDNNAIDETLAVGIAAYAPLDVIISNNTIDHSGYKDGQLVTQWAWGIWVDDNALDEQTPLQVQILNNKIGKRAVGGPNDKGIWQDIYVGSRYGAGSNVKTYSDNSVISGNVSTESGKAAVTFVHPTISYKTTGGAVVGTPDKQPNPPVIITPLPVDHGKVWFTSTYQGVKYDHYRDGFFRARDGKPLPIEPDITIQVTVKPNGTVTTKKL